MAARDRHVGGDAGSLGADRVAVESCVGNRGQRLAVALDGHVRARCAVPNEVDVLAALYLVAIGRKRDTDDVAGRLRLRALVAEPDGSAVYRSEAVGPGPGIAGTETLGRAVGRELRQLAGEDFFAALADGFGADEFGADNLGADGFGADEP